jgi:hypothetical protein
LQMSLAVRLTIVYVIAAAIAVGVLIYRAYDTASVPLLTNDSQIGANLRVCADEENRAD